MSSNGRHGYVSGPYRATKLWNEAIRNFRHGMPVGRHKRNMKQYDNCFLASDAVSWLHDYLRNNPNYGSHVTRQQTIMLLHKFLKSKIIESVRSGRNEKTSFEDDNRLYRFVFASPAKGTMPGGLCSLASGPPPPPQHPHAPPAAGGRPPPLQKAMRSNSQFGSSATRARTMTSGVYPSFFSSAASAATSSVSAATAVGPTSASAGCHVRAGRAAIGQREVELAVKREALAEFQKIIGEGEISHLVNPREISARNIYSNLTKVNKDGLVIKLEKFEDVPDWVVSAMKSLAYWPRVDPCLPQYPGFETDVFHVLKEYFVNKECGPLIPFYLYNLFIHSLVTGELVEAEALQATSADVFVKSTPSDCHVTLTSGAGGHQQPWDPPETFRDRQGSEAKSTVSTETVTDLRSREDNTDGGAMSGEVTDEEPDSDEDEENGYPVIPHSESAESLVLNLSSCVAPMEEPPPPMRVVRAKVCTAGPLDASEAGELHPARSLPLLPQPPVVQGLTPEQLHLLLTHQSQMQQLTRERAADQLPAPPPEGDLRRKQSNNIGSYPEVKSAAVRRDIRRRHTTTVAAGALPPTPRAVNVVAAAEAPPPGGPPSYHDHMTRRRNYEPDANHHQDPDANHHQKPDPNHHQEPDPNHHQQPAPRRTTTTSSGATEEKLHVKVRRSATFSYRHVQLPVYTREEDVWVRREQPDHRPADACGGSAPVQPEPEIAAESRKPERCEPVTRGQQVTPVEGVDPPGQPRKRVKGAAAAVRRSRSMTGKPAWGGTSSGGSASSAASIAAPSSSSLHGGGAVMAAPALPPRRPQTSATSSGGFTSPAYDLPWNQLRSRAYSTADLPGQQQRVEQQQQVAVRRVATAQPSSSLQQQREGSRPPRRKSATSKSGFITEEGLQTCCKALQVCCLMLPQPARKKLHLLLRLMSKVARNAHLRLHRKLSNRRLVLETFASSIIRSDVQCDLDVGQCHRVVSVLMDYCCDIMATPPHLARFLRAQEEAARGKPTRVQGGAGADACVGVQAQKLPQTSCLRSAGPVSTASPPVAPLTATYCDRVTVAEFNKQGKSTTEMAILELIEGLLGNAKISEKEKKKQLKKIQKQYPEIYALRLPHDENIPPAGVGGGGAQTDKHHQLPQPVSAKKLKRSLMNLRLP